MTHRALCPRPHRHPQPIYDQGLVCAACAVQLADRLTEAAALAPDTAATITRQTRTATTTGHTTTRPLLFSWDAANDIWSARHTLNTWATWIAAQRHLQPPTGYGHPISVLATWIAPHTDWLRHHEHALVAFDELHDACRLVIRTVDNPPVRWYAGPCGQEGCLADLYAPTGATMVRCRECGTEHDADARKEWLLGLAEDQLANATWIAATLTQLGHPVAASTVRKWAERHRLLSHTNDIRGWPLYRLGDAYDLVLEAEARDAQLQAKNSQRERMSA